MINNKPTDERLVKILSETQATINEHNRRQVRGSVEVDARLFEAVLIEAQLYRAGSNDFGGRTGRTDLRSTVLSEIGDFFAGFGGPGEPETPEEMQRELTMRIGRILNDHIVNYPRCEVLVETLKECRIARDAAQAELQERRKADNAEPIYQCEFCHHDANGDLQWHWEDVNKDFYDQYDSGRRGHRRILYAAPQPTPVIPEEIEPDSDNTYDYVDGWNACRAAMLSFREKSNS